MYIMRWSLNCCICTLFLCVIASPGQESYHFVANSNSAEATAYNNSHKVALGSGEGPNATINIVFQTQDSIYIVLTTNGGQTWSTPAPIAQGKFPAIDVNLFGFRHVAWQSTDNDIYYDCLDDWAPPVNVSQSAGISALPDLVADSSGLVHVVWVEQIKGYNHILYRTVIGGGVTNDTVRISGYGSPEAYYDHPSVSILYPDYRLYVVWQCYDSLCYSPYQIHMRYKEGTSWSTTTVWAHYLPIRHPSIDYAHGYPEDTLSFCYEDSTSGNMEATFYGGNGGGYQTQGYSTLPVVSTVGSTWSYLFWQEDSAGHADIFYGCYYCFSGWNYGSLRTLFNIQEPVKYPSVCGAYVVWTQGDSVPYSVYFGDFGYPVGIRENRHTMGYKASAKPNPFNNRTEITLWAVTESDPVVLKIFDASGRLVKTFDIQRNSATSRISVQWMGDDASGNELPVGIYWCCLFGPDQESVVKVIKVD